MGGKSARLRARSSSEGGHGQSCGPQEQLEALMTRQQQDESGCHRDQPRRSEIRTSQSFTPGPTHQRIFSSTLHEKELCDTKYISTLYRKVSAEDDDVSLVFGLLP